LFFKYILEQRVTLIKMGYGLMCDFGPLLAVEKRFWGKAGGTATQKYRKNGKKDFSGNVSRTIKSLEARI